MVGLVVVLVIAVAAVGTAIAGYTAASNAADAAALAAAPVTFRPFGAKGTPAREAARFASLNGARLVRCVCPVDASWNPRTVAVTVARSVSVLGIGNVTVRATARATFEPIRLIMADVPQALIAATARASPSSTTSVAADAWQIRMKPGSLTRHADPGVRLTSARSRIVRHRSCSASHVGALRNGLKSARRKMPASPGTVAIA